MSPMDRFASILNEERINGGLPFGAGSRVTCFTESTVAGLNFLVRERNYVPYGLVFSKDFVFRKGGGPVHYVRADQWSEHRNVSEPLRSMGVKLDPPNSDWLHEREWRLPGDLLFDPSDVQAVIVPEEDWFGYFDSLDGSESAEEVRENAPSYAGLNKLIWSDKGLLLESQYLEWFSQAEHPLAH
jgi:hypothetical protein